MKYWMPEMEDSGGEATRLALFRIFIELLQLTASRRWY